MTEATIRPPERLPLPLLRLAGDDRLAQLAAAGNRNAFAAIYSRHHQALYRYCHSLLGNPEDAADALQSAMTSALAGLDGEGRAIGLKPWLYRIAHNEAISLLRRRRPQAPSEELEASAGPALEATAESRERLRQLVADLGQLSERQRGALLMRELSGLSHAEVAAAFGVSVDAAKRTVFEARAALQELAEGRDMRCEAVRSSISERDGRLLRGRRLRAHLRDCAGCRDFRQLIGARRADLQAITPPLPAAAAAALLDKLFGGAGGGASQGAAGANALVAGGSGAGTSSPAAGGLAAWLPGGAATIGGSALGKGLAVAAAGLALAGGTAVVIDRAGDNRTTGGAPDDSAQPTPADSQARAAPAAGERQPAKGDRRERGEGDRGDTAAPAAKRRPDRPQNPSEAVPRRAPAPGAPGTARPRQPVSPPASPQPTPSPPATPQTRPEAGGSPGAAPPAPDRPAPAEIPPPPPPVTETGRASAPNPRALP